MDTCLAYAKINCNIAGVEGEQIRPVLRKSRDIHPYLYEILRSA